jgi:pimeloyl-ACP methyl ester carboxylesterase
VTLTTTRHQEVSVFLKARAHPQGGKGVQFYRDEPKLIYDLLSKIKCPVLYVFGGKSETSTTEGMAAKKKRTRNGDCEAIIIEEAGHLIPQEEVDQTGIQ